MPSEHPFFLFSKTKGSRWREPSLVTTLFLLGRGKFLVEFVDTAVAGDASLFASIERMAVRAGFDFDFFP